MLTFDGSSAPQVPRVPLAAPAGCRCFPVELVEEVGTILRRVADEEYSVEQDLIVHMGEAARDPLLIRRDAGGR